MTVADIWACGIHKPETAGVVCGVCHTTALARAHAEGLEAGLMLASAVLDPADAREWALIQKIRSLIPAAPLPEPQPEGHQSAAGRDGEGG